ncbi:allophycocyanin-like protein [Synechococcus sp. BIOS-U3-1]|uniref:phycobilisome polypeptide n=1 Tax=Synechococcus sp. BIOS-U3-1 TaxID=1400865 RepID=UPI001646E5F9|nr:phycobilisome polypeptide [Synechococcus sp. BIOS-U3-1]QNI57490.1 allophycocyanin-like protein [Synechococcus sp. BIOS-U3-1]
MSSTSAEQIKELAQQSKVCGLSGDRSIPGQLRDLIDEADQHKRLLSDEEIQLCCGWSGVEAAPLIALQGQVSHLVDQSRADLLSEQPELVQPGGKLFPQLRAEACWRDCFHFLRVSIYGSALRRTDVTDSDGMRCLAELYALLDVPVPALLLALDRLRVHSVASYSRLGAGAEAKALGDALTHLCNMIRKEMKRHDGTQQKDSAADIK